MHTQNTRYPEVMQLLKTSDPGLCLYLFVAELTLEAELIQRLFVCLFPTAAVEDWMRLTFAWI